nr:NADH dehydrogenase subunit 3 [Abscondita chinensis]
MSIMKCFAMITFILTMIIMMLSSFLSKKMIIDGEKSTPIESGFDPKSSTRMPYSLQLFLFGKFFLILDVDITLLSRLVITMKITSILSFSLITIMFILILLIGLYHEWNQGALNWAL